MALGGQIPEVPQSNRSPIHGTLDIKNVQTIRKTNNRLRPVFRRGPRALFIFGQRGQQNTRCLMPASMKIFNGAGLFLLSPQHRLYFLERQLLFVRKAKGISG